MSDKNKFEPTRWSLVSMVRKGDSRQSLKALNTLLEIYWFPLYAFARSSGRQQEDAEDLVQGFSLSLIERSGFKNIDKENGKLRTYLIKSFKNFMASDLRKKYAIKRGAGESPLSIDAAEEKYQLQPYTDLSPDNIYDKAWALELLNQTMQSLEEYYVAKDRLDVYNHIKVYLGWNSGEETYESLSEKSGISVSSIKVEVSRMRKRYKDILTENVKQTVDVSTEDEIRAELMELLTSVG